MAGNETRISKSIMAKRLTIPADLFSPEELDLINRATYRTEKRIMLRSKRKFLKEDPEGWLVANSIAYHHYKNVKIPIETIIGEFASKYTGEDAAEKARTLVALGNRAMEAFYAPRPEDIPDKEDSGWCEECGYWNMPEFTTKKLCPHYIPPVVNAPKQIISWCSRCSGWHIAVRVENKEYDADGNLVHGKSIRIKCPLDDIIVPEKPFVPPVLISWGDDSDEETGSDGVESSDEGGESSAETPSTEDAPGDDPVGEQRTDTGEGTVEPDTTGDEHTTENASPDSEGKVDIEW